MIHVDAWQKPTQYCKAIILQLKILQSFYKIIFWKTSYREICLQQIIK